MRSEAPDDARPCGRRHRDAPAPRVAPFAALLPAALVALVSVGACARRACEAPAARCEPAPLVGAARAVRTLRGRVLRADGSPEPYVRLRVVRVPRAASEGATPPKVASVTSRPDGSFEFVDLPRGALRVFAGKPNGTCHGGFERYRWQRETDVAPGQDFLEIRAAKE